MSQRCESCGRAIQPRVTVPNQKYCSRRECQAERRRRWQRLKIKEDSDYRVNQAEAQRRWRGRNPDYWRQYRARHPEYVDRNRQRQRERNRWRVDGRGETEIAKMDALTPSNPLISGSYRLVPLCGEGLIAKMDALTVKIEVISTG